MDKYKLVELAAQCEIEAVKQAEYCMSNVSFEEGSVYSAEALKLFQLAAALRSHAPK